MQDLNRDKLIELIALSSFGSTKTPLNLQGLDLSNLDFSNLDISDINFKSTKLTNSTFKNNVFSNTSISEFIEDVVFENVLFKNVNFESKSFEKTKFISCKFETSNIINPRYITSENFITCTFENCWKEDNPNSGIQFTLNDGLHSNKFSNSQLGKISFDDIYDYKFDGTHFYKCQIQRDIEDCNFNYSSFTETFFDATFKDTGLSNVSFSNCNCKYLIFKKNCSLENIFFNNIQSKGTGIVIQGSTLKGYLRFENCFLDNFRFRDCNKEIESFECWGENFILNQETLEENGIISIFPSFLNKYELRQCEIMLDSKNVSCFQIIKKED